MPTSIYVLSDPTSGEIRYVGKTTQKPKYRHKSHWAQARWQKKLPQTHVARWIRTLSQPPLMTVLVVAENILGGEIEKRVIALYRSMGARLTNLTDGGDGQPGYKLTSEQRARRQGLKHRGSFPKGHQMTPEDRLAQRAMMKGNQFRKGHPLSPEHKARMIVGVRRSFARRRGGLIVGPDWEAVIPYNPRVKVAFPKHERRGWHNRRVANGLHNLGWSYKEISERIGLKAVSALVCKFRNDLKKQRPLKIIGETWEARFIS